MRSVAPQSFALVARFRSALTPRIAAIFFLLPGSPRRVFLICAALAAPLMGCGKRMTTPAARPEMAQYEQGMKLLRDGNILGAQAAFDTAIRLNARFASAYLAQAEIARNTGDISHAIELMETLRRNAPETPHVTCRLAELHAATGRFVEAIAAAKLAVQQEPDCPLAKTEYGQQLAAAGQLKEAIVQLQVAHHSAPQSERISLILAQMLARDDKPEEAWKLLDTLPTPSRLPVQSQYTRAWLLAEYGRLGKRDEKSALALLDRALAEAPDDGLANLEKGRILLGMGNAHGALMSLKRARDVSAPSVDLLNAIARSQAKLKSPNAARLERSAHLFAKLVDELYSARQRYLADPTSRDNLVKLARLEAEIGNTRDAQNLLTQVLQQNPNDVEALELLTPGREIATHSDRAKPTREMAPGK